MAALSASSRCGLLKPPSTRRSQVSRPCSSKAMPAHSLVFSKQQMHIQGSRHIARADGDGAAATAAPVSLEKTGPNFPALRDINAIMQTLPHRWVHR